MLDTSRHQQANEYADQMVRDPEWAALTMPLTPAAALLRATVWHAVRKTYLDLTT